MTMDFFLDRQSQQTLREKLATVPHLVEELVITETRQARIQRVGLKLHRSKPESRLPFHIPASEASDALQNALATWTRHVCETRCIRYTGPDDALSLSRWLIRNMTALALTEGSEEAADDICARIDECRRQIDLPPDDEIVIDRARVNEANRVVVTAGQVDKLAVKLGALGVGLNKRRVETLARSGRLRACTTDGDVKFFRLGDVLDSHFRHARRKAQ